MTWLRRSLAALLLLGIVFVGIGYWNATRDPVVREAALSPAGWPQGTPPLRLLLISDIHVAGPDMPPERLTRIVEQVNALEPDLVLIAGDFISEKRLATHVYTPAEVVAPLAELKAPLGTLAVLGNHDHWADRKAFAEAIENVGIVLLRNRARRVGPLVIGGVDDEFSHHEDVEATLAAMDRLGNAPRLVLTHSPDIIPALNGRAPLLLAGHTHCGQVRLPLIGAITTMSRYGERYGCGHIVEDGTDIFVGAGLGTSIVPMRFGAPPDMWLLTLGPPETAE